MNLPEGYLLQVIQEAFGPHIGANPLALLAVIGRSMVGRVQVGPVGATLDTPPQPLDMAGLLQGDNSEVAFAQLVRRYVVSGVSGIVPKFLARDATQPTNKPTVVTTSHIIKGSSSLLPHIALNEYFCMEVARRLTPCATTEVSQDGQALVVGRFDLDPQGRRLYGMEDFCALLGMRPANKYETTWERIAKAVRTYLRAESIHEAYLRLTHIILLTYALRNGDCHAKNLALLYTSRNDAVLAPCYDMLTTSVYAGYEHNPPAISFMGKKTWKPGKSLQTFLTNTFNVNARTQKYMVDQIGDAMADVAPQLRGAMQRFPSFEAVGARMLVAWRQGLDGLRNKQHYAMSAWSPHPAFGDLSPVAKHPSQRTVTGQSELLKKNR